MVRIQNSPVNAGPGSSAKDAGVTKNARRQEPVTIDQIKLALRAGKAGIWDWNILENTFVWSEEFLLLFGMGPDTVPGFEAWKKAVHPDDAEMAGQRISEAIEQRQELHNEYRIVLPSGEIRWILGVGYTLYREQVPERMIGLCIDISPLKMAEQSLAESEGRFAKAFQNAPVLMAISTLSDGEYLEVNEEFIRLLGYARAEVIGKTSVELNILNPEARMNLVAELKKIGSINGIELELKTKNGSVIYCLFNAHLIDFRGRPHLLSTAVDVTLRKRAEEELRRKEGHASSILSTAMDGFWIVTDRGKIEEVNQAACTMLGYSKEEFLQLHIHDLEHQETREETRSHIERVISNGYDRFETVYRCKDGRLINVEVSVIWQKEMKVFYAFLRDVTKQRKTELELKQEMSRLEMLNAHMVDRELRMIELKKENAALRQRLAELNISV